MFRKKSLQTNVIKHIHELLQKKNTLIATLFINDSTFIIINKI